MQGHGTRDFAQLARAVHGVRVVACTAQPDAASTRCPRPIPRLAPMIRRRDGETGGRLLRETRPTRAPAACNYAAEGLRRLVLEHLGVTFPALVDYSRRTPQKNAGIRRSLPPSPFAFIRTWRIFSCAPVAWTPLTA